MAIITVNNVWSRISDLNNVEVADALDNTTSFYVEGYRYTKAFQTGWYDKASGQFKRWDGKKHLLTQKMVFPTGLLERVKRLLKRKKIKYTIDDKRAPVKHGRSIKIKNYTPRFYQKDALDAAVAHGRGIIRVGTGGGKTLIAAMMLAKYNVPAIVYVIGKDLLYQFHEELEKALGVKVGIIGDGKCDVKKFNVCSVWTAATAFNLKSKVSLDDEDWAPEVSSINSANKTKIKKAIEKSNLAIFDEAHFLGTDTLQSIFKVGKQCRYLFGLSGTDWRDDGADLLLESVCGKRIYNMPATKLIEAKFLVPPKITFLDVPKYEEDLPKHYASVYSKYITKNEIRNGMIISAARKLISMGRKPLILVRYLSHGQNLADELSDMPIYFVNGEVDGETRQEVKSEFIAGNLKCLIASSVFDIGVNIPCLDALILAGGGKSSVRALQRIGRVIRTYPNKDDAIIVDFIDNAKYLDKHTATRTSVYETEPAFRIKFPKNFDTSRIKKNNKIIKKIGK
jgi:superfamily II DNA or RNA helicase